MSLSKLYHKVSTKWEVGFMKFDESALNNESLKVNWLKHNCKNRWFADPQILSHKDNIIKVLVEDFYYDIDRGQISLLYVDDKTFELKDIKVILTLDTHLSFPIIYRKGGRTFIYPENGESGKLRMYEYDESKDELVGAGVTISSHRLADAVIMPDDNNLMFATSASPNGNFLDVLRYSEKEHRFMITSQIEFTENLARNAGPFFYYRENLVRPAQICNRSYGEGVELQIIEQAENINFKPIARLYSPHPKHKLAFHTFCVYEDLVAVDCMGYARWFSPILDSIIKLVRNYKHSR